MKKTEQKTPNDKESKIKVEKKLRKKSFGVILFKVIKVKDQQLLLKFHNKLKKKVKTQSSIQTSLYKKVYNKLQLLKQSSTTVKFYVHHAKDSEQIRLEIKRLVILVKVLASKRTLFSREKPPAKLVKDMDYWLKRNVKNAKEKD